MYAVIPVTMIFFKSSIQVNPRCCKCEVTSYYLKEHNVECYFEKENIWTFDGKGEVLLTIMSSLAQEESRSISENCTWGQRKRFADGKVTVPFNRFLGYDRGKDGNLVVNSEQAKLVRRIYGMFLTGVSPISIARTLTSEGIPSPGGKDHWNASNIRSILTKHRTTDFIRCTK